MFSNLHPDFEILNVDSVLPSSHYCACTCECSAYMKDDMPRMGNNHFSKHNRVVLHKPLSDSVYMICRPLKQHWDPLAHAMRLRRKASRRASWTRCGGSRLGSWWPTTTSSARRWRRTWKVWCSSIPKSRSFSGGLANVQFCTSS